MKRLFVITGPTASGKTDLAISIARDRDGAVVSADSRQVYAGMNIGTAKAEFAWSDATHDILEPDFINARVALRGGSARSKFRGAPSTDGGSGTVVRAERVPAVTGPGPHHYGFNLRYPNEPLSLSDWQAMAFAVIDEIHKAGMPAVLAGGTMLYIDSIVKNYDLPAVAPNEELRAEYEKKDAPTLYAELLLRDPKAQSFIQPDNKRRIIRALEVMAATDRPFSEQRRQRPPRYDVTMIGLFDSWEALEKRIAARVATMMEEGLIAETQRLIDRYGADLPLLQTMNYKQALGILSGELSPDQAQEKMVRANLKYARRQMSWWRGRTDITWHSPTDIADIKKRLLNL
jgi:tRNA dimethylallyltransferase